MTQPGGVEPPLRAQVEAFEHTISVQVTPVQATLLGWPSATNPVAEPSLQLWVFWIR
jgi:hypothetical protein